MTVDRLRVIVGGLIVQYPIGGHIWSYLQFLLCLRDLGHEVLYVEDNAQWPYDPTSRGVSRGCSYNVEFAAQLFGRHRFDWAYRFPGDGRWRGPAAGAVDDAATAADLIINVSGALDDPERFSHGATMVYVDTDPVFTQIRLASGDVATRRQLRPHHLHFSWGELLGAAPASEIQWLASRQPVALDEWSQAGPPGSRWTTVMNWTSVDDVEFAGTRYGQKDAEFVKFERLPELVDVELEVAMAEGATRPPPTKRLRRAGWSIVDAAELSSDERAYRNYIWASRAEWSVAKSAYVIGRSGWFSDRSAAYLASGRPVVLQDTGFSSVLPTGEGLLAFTTLDEAQAAINAVEADLDLHSRAAREIAHEHFDGRKVVGDIIDRASQVSP